MFSWRRQFLVVLFVCTKLSQAVIHLSISSPFYIKKGVDVTIPWAFTDDVKDIGLRQWFFGNPTHPAVFKKMIGVFGDGNLIRVTGSPLKNVQVIKPATLVIKNPSLSNSGTYRFEIRLMNGTILRSNVEIIVVERPETEINCSVENDGNDISCDCSCIGGNPTPTATWYLNNVNIGGTGAPKNTLSLKNIKMDDAGTYYCTCRSHNLKSGKEMKLFSPTNICFSSKKTKETVYVGQTVRITCETEGYPTPTYTLYHNGSELTKNIVDGKYNIGKVKYDDAGLYKCVATNNLGNAFKSFELIVSVF